MKKEFETLRCVNPECKKILIKADTLSKIRELVAKDRYIQCCYCGKHHVNAFWEGYDKNGR